MKNSKLRFSIVVPCYNEAGFIAQTLRSLKAQRFSGNYEIIVVDNNCTDETASIAKTFGVRVVTEKHSGVCWARQAGTEAARGEIIISADADTTYSSSWLQAIDQSFKSDENCVAVAGPCIYRDGPRWGKHYPKLLFGAVNIFYKVTGKPFYITATNIAFRKSAWIGYNTNLTQGGDELALLGDLKKKGAVIFNYKNPVYTSGRRLTRGFIYNFFITFLVYYLLAYYVNKFMRRTVIGAAPAYRAIAASNGRVTLFSRITLVVAIGALIHIPGHDTLLQQTYETFAETKQSYLSDKHSPYTVLNHLITN